MIFSGFKEQVKENTNFRRVVYTGKYEQLVLMSIPVDGDIGDEVHPNTDQILYFVDGNCEIVLDGETKRIEKESIVFVPAGTRHNFKNIGDQDLKIFTIYAPPAHKDGTTHKAKEDVQDVEKYTKGEVL